MIQIPLPFENYHWQNITLIKSTFFSVSEFLLAHSVLWQLGTELYLTFPQSEAPQKLGISDPSI